MFETHGGRRRSCILASKNTTRITSVVWPLEWTPMFGLPGNPVSSHVVFRMLVVPYLRGSIGTTYPQDQIVHARLQTKVRSTTDCLTYGV